MAKIKTDSSGSDKGGDMKISDLKFEPHPGGFGGTQAKVKFKNGYGASIITGPMFYTDAEHPYEIAVLNLEDAIDYTTPITNDVVGHLNEEEANEILSQIENLPKGAKIVYQKICRQILAMLILRTKEECKKAY